MTQRTLAQAELGETLRIDTVGGTGELRQHFLDMGVIPGAAITFVKYAPMGDPMEFTLRGYQLTLRVADAEKIGVSPLPEGGAPAPEAARAHEFPCRGAWRPFPQCAGMQHVAVAASTPVDRFPHAPGLKIHDVFKMLTFLM